LQHSISKSPKDDKLLRIDCLRVYSVLFNLSVTVRPLQLLYCPVLLLSLLTRVPGHDRMFYRGPLEFSKPNVAVRVFENYGFIFKKPRVRFSCRSFLF
jgi:hypothetical protein